MVSAKAMTRARITQTLSRLRLPVYHVSRRYESSTASREAPFSGPRSSLKSYPIQSGADTFHPNMHIRNVANQHNMGFPVEVLRFKINLKPNPANVQAFVSNRHCVNIYDMKYLADHIHPYTQTVLDRYISQKERPLWWSISSFGDATRIVITKAERWLRRGIRLALEAKGYDKYGKRVTEQVVGGRATQDLYGTLRVTCPQAKVLCQLKFSEVQVLSTNIVDALEKRFQRDTTGNHIATNHGPAKSFRAPNGQVRRILPEKSAWPGSKTQKSSGETPKAQNTQHIARKAHEIIRKVSSTTLKTNPRKEQPR